VRFVGCRATLPSILNIVLSDARRCAGIGLIEKTSKNHIQWKAGGAMGDEDRADDLSELHEELELLNQKEAEIDDQIRCLVDKYRKMFTCFDPLAQHTGP
jgi:hypothetical protein